MKSNNKLGKGYRYKSYIAALSALLVLGLSACTKNFETFNTDPRGLSNAQLQLPTVYIPIEQGIFQNYQVAQNLNADYYCGYATSPQGFGRSLNNADYAFVDGWNNTAFYGAYTSIIGPIKNTIGSTDVRTSHPDLWAVALVIEVEGEQRITDKFGPVPYDAVGKSLTTTPYDSQQDIYNRMFAQLDTAAASLSTFVGTGATSLLVGNDAIYNGDMSKWLRLANSERLRLAMNIVKVDPVTAQAQAEKAMAATGGLVDAIAYNAAVSKGLNDYNQITLSYGDNRMSATIQSYMNGYNDPREHAYFLVVNGDPSQSSSTGPMPAAFANTFVGIALGSPFQGKPFYSGYSSYNYLENFTASAPEEFLCAPEIWFLKAEAALRGWAGAGDAATDFTTGVTLDMQRNAAVSVAHPITAAAIAAYLADNTSKPTDYVDPQVPANNLTAIGTISPAWDPAASKELMLEHIITQKWLAMFPEGQQAWNDFRRTGYPRVFPTENNASGGTIDTKIQVRRLPFPLNEPIQNAPAYTAGVALLGGADNGGTRLWWDKDLGGVNF